MQRYRLYLIIPVKLVPDEALKGINALKYGRDDLLLYSCWTGSYSYNSTGMLNRLTSKYLCGTWEEFEAYVSACQLTNLSHLGEQYDKVLEVQLLGNIDADQGSSS